MHILVVFAKKQKKKKGVLAIYNFYLKTFYN